MIGAMTRLMTSQSSVMFAGMTGCTLSTLAGSSAFLMPKKVLFCSGKLIMSATGFCAALASSDVSWAWAAVAVTKLRPTMTAKPIAKADRFIQPIGSTNLTPGASDLGAHEFLALYAGCAFYVEEEGVPAYDELIVVANADKLDDRRLVPFLRALEAGVQYLINHPQESWRLFIKRNPLLDDELNRRAWPSSGTARTIE